MEHKTNPIAEREKQIQKFWEDNKIFEKSLEQTRTPPTPDSSGEASGPAYSFYDGPPFATGTPHYGHMVASLMKDAVPRFWTMRGRYVERRWGWDCHGLPIENMVEKELGFKSKKDIVAYGIANFNEYCRSKVLLYVEEWKKTIKRFGRWADMENPYKTMDRDYMESIWWVFKQLWDKGLIYEGFRSMHICPHCETTLSQSEVSEGYRDVEDLSITWKFKVAGQDNTYLLAWTTVPWSTLSTMGLAIGADFDYVKAKVKDEYVIFIKDKLEKVMAGISDYEIVDEFKGSSMVGWEYEPVSDVFKNLPEVRNKKNTYHVFAADYVEAAEGTGIVTINGSYGEVDLLSAQQNDLPVLMDVKMDGTFAEFAGPYAGLYVKDAQVKFVADMEKKGLVWDKEKYVHSYPHCWRCDTPLLNYSTSSWFVKVTAIKPRALELAKQINWSPSHIKEGRFGKWLEGARDWSISRQRFWASVIPIWKCAVCGELKVYGAVADLERDSGREIIDLHKHIIDDVEVPCQCGGRMKRVADVLDTWFDSGSMPYAQQHYPFENKEKFEAGFPAQFIAEGVDQCRAWFYYLHIIATSIKDNIAYKNVIANGIVLAGDGKKMSKRLANYTEPEIIMEQYGADALRYYLLTSPVMQAENLNFDDNGVKEAMQKVVMLLNNILNFYKLYQNVIPSEVPAQGRDEAWGSRGNQNGIAAVAPLPRNDNVLDKWLLAKLQQLINEATKQMEAYDLPRAVRPLQDFIAEFSTWWLRRSRDRFKGTNEADKTEALATFKYVLTELAKVMAPFTPFIAEHVYKEVSNELESVHLEKWPAFAEATADDAQVINQMEQVRKIVELGLAARAEAGVKIRQPLAVLKVQSSKFKVQNNDPSLDLIKDEINVKQVLIVDDLEKEVELDLNITEALQVEGMARELVRSINDLRKKAGLSINDTIKVSWQSQGEVLNKVFNFAEFVAELKHSTITSEFIRQDNDGQELEINGEKIKIMIEKI